MSFRRPVIKNSLQVDPKYAHGRASQLFRPGLSHRAAVGRRVVVVGGGGGVGHARRRAGHVAVGRVGQQVPGQTPPSYGLVFS